MTNTHAQSAIAPVSPEFTAKYVEKINELFSQLNLAYPGLETVKKAAEAQDWPTACDGLIQYYQQSKSGVWLRLDTPQPSTGTVAAVDTMIAGTFTFQGVTAKVARIAGGSLAWNDLGPRKDPEWAYFLNRFFYFKDFLAAWQETGNPIYPKAMNNLLADWIPQNPAPSESVKPTWSWRVLEAGLRLTTWPPAFYGLQQTSELTAETRVLMLASLIEQADFVSKNHMLRHNHATMELCGLATTALAFPEFKNSEKWFNHAQEGMCSEITFQTYPDGAQNELCAHYHWVSMRYFQDFADVLQAAGRPIPKVIQRNLENLLSYLALTISPTGHNLLNNDSDLRDYRELLLAAAKKYNRPDWAYTASNGTEGTRPTDPPSRFFPWAGQLLMRNGWAANAQFAFFDVGPWGNSHQHNDKLHLSVAYGRDLLVDTGRWGYQTDAFRFYFNLSAGHNVILLDGQGQNETELLATKPQENVSIIQPGYDFCIGRYTSGFGDGWHGDPAARKPGEKNIPGQHTRAVVYVRDRFWLVVDQVTSDQAREMSALWHFAPDCTVTVHGGETATNDAGKGNLRVLPVGKIDWKVLVIKGQEKPEVQGWFSERYNEKVPSPCAIYRARMPGKATFAWILQPFLDRPSQITTRLLPAPEGVWKAQISEAGRKPVEIEILLNQPDLPATGQCRVQGLDPLPMNQSHD